MSHNIANPIPIITTFSPLSVYKLIQCCTNSLLYSVIVNTCVYGILHWSVDLHQPVLATLL